MRLVLVNPHTQNFGKSVAGVLLRRKDFLKYDYFVDFFIKRKGKSVAFLIDGTRTSLSGIGLSLLFSLRVFAWLELVVWMLINGINPIRVRVYFNVSKLDPKNDILFDFSRSIIDINDQKKLLLNQFQGITIIHFTHYFKNVERLSDYIKTIPNCVVVAENDLTKNHFFQKYFNYVKEVYHLPFAYGERFVVQNKFESRINRCLALGSITRVRNRAFLDFFGDSEGLHPMRKRIYESLADCTKEIDCLIRGFDDTSNVREVQVGDSIFVKFARRHLPFFFLEKLYPTPQIAYFKFDIVEKFNAYKMFLCSEESVGLPSINVFEGMATQNVYVGIDNPMYMALGMRPGIHYIGYKEDNFDDLLEKIRYYQANPDKLCEISMAGYNFVRENFSRENIAHVFWRDLEDLSHEFSSSGSRIFLCSFKKILQ